MGQNRRSGGRQATIADIERGLPTGTEVYAGRPRGAGQAADAGAYEIQ